jgi:PAS domain S-box-containing protein
MENNFEIDNATSVDEAFKKLEQQPYDAIVSDYEMPQKNGLDFLKKIREENNQIPFILFTGKGREGVAVKALNLGADRYIDKNGSTETVYCELADAINKSVESKESKKALAESELNYRTMVEKSLQGVLITQVSPLRLVFANASMSKMLGYSIKELKSLSPKGVAELIYNEDRIAFFARLESRMRGEPAPSSLEFRAVRKNGSLVWLEAFASRIEYMGQPAVQGMFLDIDERKKVNEILRESEQKYRELANSLPNIVYESDITGKVEFVNDKGLEIAGVSNEDFKKELNILQFLIPEDRQRAMESMQRLLAGGSNVPSEYVFLRKDGSTFPTLIATTLRISGNKVTGFRGLVIDITERKQMEQDLQASDAKFKAINESAIDAIFLFDEEDRIVYWNPAAEQIFGYTASEIIGKKVSENLVPPRFGKDHLNLIAKLAEVEKKKVTGEILEFPALRKDGSEFPIELSMTAFQLEGIRYFTAIARDVTERKIAEEKVDQMVNQLVLVNEKLGVVGSLTRHDVRNKLSAVTGYAYLLKKKHSDLTDIVDGLSKMEQAVAESVKIFDFAKLYEQLGVEDLTYVNVDAKLKEAVALFSGSLPAVKNECRGMTVLADSFLRQLFYNFIDNTRKYGEKTTTIRVYYEEADQESLKLIYEDDGVGVSLENKPCLFKEGFSTGGSTGFGLFLTKKMMDVYGWEIQENGEPGKGAKFTITIPKTSKSGKENYRIDSKTSKNL